MHAYDDTDRLDRGCARTGSGVTKGGSTGEGRSIVWNLNHAVSGAKVRNMPSQADALIEDFRRTLGEQYSTDWKVCELLLHQSNDHLTLL